MKTQINTAFGSFELQRYPIVKKQPLQAWDAADEYLIDDLSDQKKALLSKKILIFNDSFGALTLPLNKFNPVITTDSFLSKLAIEKNYSTNNLNLNSLQIIDSLSNINSHFDLILIKVPKSMDFLRYFINQIHPVISENTQIIVAGMVKSMPKSLWNTLEDLLGTTTTSLAKKKAKLIYVKPEKLRITSNYPKYFIQEKTNYKIYNHANVFSKHSLDIGTRFLLQNIPMLEKAESIIDLGCGNGIVGLNFLKIYPNAKVLFTDESFMAVESARLTIENNNIDTGIHQFRANDCLDGMDHNCVDLIVCNPPFHQSHSIGLQSALQMFQQSFNVLKPKGHLIVIANRHLPYYSHLKRIFGTVQNLASNNKFSLFILQKKQSKQ